MSPADDDIFGKMDALLGKRAGFGGAARLRDDIDFPVLTEVVEAPGVEPTPLDPTAPEQPEVTANWQMPEPITLPEAAPTVEPADPWPLPPGPEVNRLVWGDEPGSPGEPDEIEALTAPTATLDKTPPVPQDTELEAMLRRIVREELERILGRG